MKHFVSIITPTYNSEKSIEETLNSILKQTYTKWEVIITDDNSTDRTVSIIQKYINKDSRIKLHIFDTNQGAGAARNNSISYAKGKYIAFCDSDDLWEPNKLEVQIEFLKKENLVFTFSDYSIINSSGDVLDKVKCPNNLSYRKLLRNNYVGCLTAMYDCENLGKIYMPKIRKRQDWVLWLSILSRIKTTKGINLSLAKYRITGESISSNKISLIKYNFEVYNNILDFGYLKSIVYIFVFTICYFFKKVFKINL